MSLDRKPRTSCPRNGSAVPHGANVPAIAHGQDAACARAVVLEESLRVSLRPRPPRRLRPALGRPATPVADRSAFRCAVPAGESYVRATAVPAPGFSVVPNATRTPVVRCAVGDRRRSRGSSIVSEKARHCEHFLARRPDFLIIQTAAEMFYAAGSLRYHFDRGRACARSIPLINIANSSARIVTLATSFACGQWKRPRSNRFAHT